MKSLLGLALTAIFALYGLVAIGVIPSEHMQQIDLNQLRDNLIAQRETVQESVQAQSEQTKAGEHKGFTDHIVEKSKTEIQTSAAGESQQPGRYRLKAAGGGAEIGMTELSSRNLASPKPVKYIKSL